MSRRERKMPKGFTVVRGFGLIELMIAMLIGLGLMAATLTIYLDMTRSNNELAKTNTQMENGRLAIQLLRGDLEHAGFWNGFVPEFDDLTEADVPGDYPSSIPEPCASYADWTVDTPTNLIGVPVQVYADVPSGCSGVVTDKVEASDVLVVSHVQTCAAGATGCEAESAGKLYWQTSNCSSEARYQLDDSGFSMHKRDCTTLAAKRKFVNNIYYLRDYAVTTGDGIPTLMQSTFDLSGGALIQQPATAMIEGVEAMRFEFGVDALSDTDAAVDYSQAVQWVDEENKNSPSNRGDGAADEACTSATPCDLDQLANTVVVKIYLLVRSLEPTQGYSSDKTYSLAGEVFGPFDDAYQRHVYSSTVRLVNVSGRRETP
ncbi:pilus assembly protein PilW [Pseudomonas alcaligenes]|uniref:Pilus assembly protein PilW n=1 Tax=Aquipseudomonas alcaligenes TaxID=43263 RepID=A0ABR7S1W7_AQUAC|nr:PilW family protein [Pseudomonas alcaligenes]MBC9251468.1 pilus assembly protein PilW [Pseudomonas alcaligenes]